MAARQDWLKRPLPELNVMFDNVGKKIDDYETAYGLTAQWIARVKLICQTFIAAYEGVAGNRATAKDLNEWFEKLLNGEPQGAAATAAPTFQTITLPAGAFVGLLDEFRDMMRFFKANPAYTEADGENLMIVAPATDRGDINNAAPELKISTDANGAIIVGYVREEFSGLELQWRKAGDEMWQMADKSTESTLSFTPPNSGTPQKIELRAVYLLKNARVGQWSPLYTATVG